MRSTVRFGIVGCGEVSVDTCLSISNCPAASVTMLMDPEMEATRDLAEVYAAPATSRLGDVLASPDVDAVYVATPHDLHADIGVQAARAGKHVLMEKPITTTLADADRLIAACREAGVRLGVAFYAQTDSNLAYTRDLVRAGVIGEIISVRLAALANKPATYWHGGYTQRVATDWRTSKQRAGGGVLMMNVIHDINTLFFVTGLEPERIYAEVGTLSTSVEVEDTIGAVIRFTNGAIGTAHGGSAFPGGAHEDARGARVYGTRGQLILGPRVYAWLDQTVEGSQPNTWHELRVPDARGGRDAMVDGFVQAVRTDTEPPVSGTAARKALELVLAAYRSGELGVPVSLPL